MKLTQFKLLFLSFLYMSTGVSAVNYSDYFNDKTCRVDFYFSGNANTTNISIDKIYVEQFWGGRRNNLSVDINLGDYRFQVIDSVSGKLLYTDGFNSLYREWQSTPESSTVSRSIEQSIVFPFPNSSVILIIQKRLDFDRWQDLFSYPINPANKFIYRLKPVDAKVKILTKTHPSEHAIDIAIIAEGYSSKERLKFFRDARLLQKNILSHEPFKSYQNRLNFYAIAAESVESGISQPQLGIWKKTALKSQFYTFYSPRYLTTFNSFLVHDYAALVPYDAVYILANTETYGGGGFYNMYALTAAHNQLSTEVTVHEFGHSFAGLGDEYFREGSDVLDSMYDINIEPWEPNITSLKKFDLKWGKMLDVTTKVPTPVTVESRKKVGVFEGGGYLTKGIYRPMYDCRMRTNKAPEFCPVCKGSVEKKILFLTE